MCELFSLSARFPTNVTLSLDTFSQRGGGTGPHKDGWGVAFYEGNDAWILRDSAKAFQSPWIELLTRDARSSALVLSHIRLATMGDNILANTQPFTYILSGKRIVFTHNGHIPDIFDNQPKQYYQPLGSTDSEILFSGLLTILEKSKPLSEPQLFDEIEKYFQSLSVFGPLNVNFSDGAYLYAFSNKRTQEDKTIAAPGMHYLCRYCNFENDLNLSGVTLEGHDQKLVLFASVPLSDEQWMPMQPNKLYVVKNGDWLRQY